jgi:eukaryotic-like serine/threonine-protein kinase
MAPADMSKPSSERETETAPVDPAPSAISKIYLFGHFRIDVASLQLLRDDHVIPLTPKVFDTLQVLVRHSHRVVTKDELMRIVWHDSIVSEDSLSQSISALRRALGDDPNHPQFVATIPRRGYRFIAEVTEISQPESHRALPAAVDATPIVTALVAPLPRAWEGPTRRDVRTFARRSLVLMMIGLVAVIGAVVGKRLTSVRADPDDASGPVRFTVQAPADTTVESSAILSPDSRHIVFAAQDRSGTTRLWLRDLDSADARPLRGTEGALRPFWSPDGQSLGFFAGGDLKKVSLGGDPPQTLATVGLSPGGGTWGSASVIVYAGWRSGLYSVPAGGGTPAQVTELDSGENEAWHLTPQFLPDGRHFLYNAATGDPAHAATYGGSLDSRERTRVLDVGGAVFAPPSHLLYVRDRTLVVQEFDPDRLRVSGQPRTLVGNVSPPDRAGVISATPRLVSFGGGIGDARLVWFDRAGEPIRVLDAPVTLHQPAFSRDQKQLLASGGTGRGRGVWTVNLDLERNAATRIADGGTKPTSSPDGTRIAFTSDRLGGIFNIYVKTIGANGDELLLQTRENKIVYDWSPDGQYIVYGTTNAETKKDIWLLPMHGDRQPRRFFVTPFNEIQARVSPDGRWIAYASDESGRFEVYVQSFPVAGNKRGVSVVGGAQPQWRRDGRELYYLSVTHGIMAVPLNLAGNHIGSPEPLFQAPVWGDLSTYRSQYLSSADGQRFLVDAIHERNSRDPITVIVNWPKLLLDNQ